MVRQSYGQVYVQSSKAKNKAQPDEARWKRDLRGLQTVVFQWRNILLVCVPIGLFVVHDPIWIFWVNFLAIIPLASLIFVGIEIASEHLGPQGGGLLDAFLGKSVEQIMCVQCMRAGLVEVLQGNLMGSLHWNLLLVLGMSIFVSGLMKSETQFKAEGAAAQMSCQIVASISIALPTMFRTVGHVDNEILMLSRAIAFVTMGVYMLFLFFHFKTHLDAFDDDGKATVMRSMTGAAVGRTEEYDTDDAPLLSTCSAFVLLALSIVVVGCCSELLVDNIHDVSEHFGIPKAFIGCTLLPIIGNTAEHVAAMNCAAMGKMDVVIDIAVGSATQIALFVIPGAVLWGWVFGNPMTLDFRNFDATVMMASTFLVSQVLSHGNTNWLHGAMLMTTYILIAIISWFIPELT